MWYTITLKRTFAVLTILLLTNSIVHAFAQTTQTGSESLEAGKSESEERNAIEEIQFSIDNLSSEAASVRRTAISFLRNADRSALPLVLEAIVDSSTNKNSKESLVGVVTDWASLWSGEEVLELFEALHEEQTAAVSELHGLRSHYRLVGSVRNWLSDGTKLVFHADGKTISIFDWEYSERESKLLGLLPKITQMNVYSELPKEFYVLQKNSAVETLRVANYGRRGSRRAFVPVGVMDGPTMQAILQMESVSMLKLNRIEVTNEAAVLLGASKNIINLKYRYSGPIELIQIGKMRQLESLNIGGEVEEAISVSASDLQPLSQLKNIQEIEFGFVEVEPAGMEAFIDLTELRSMGLKFPNENLLEAIIQNKNITQLRLLPVATKADEVAQQLSRAGHLRSVWIDNYSMTNVGLDALLEIESLEHLSVAGGFFSKESLGRAKRKLGDSGFVGYADADIGEDESLAIHEFAKMGLLAQSCGAM